MVHALEEVHRLLAPEGLLIDLRPLMDRWPVEVTSSAGYQEIGRVTDLPEPIADDRASDEAFAAQTARGLFVRERQESFPLFYYWDTPKEMRAYVEESWDDVVLIEDALWKRLGPAWAGAGADARVRLRMKMTIGRYRKRPV